MARRKPNPKSNYTEGKPGEKGEKRARFEKASDSKSPKDTSKDSTAKPGDEDPTSTLKSSNARGAVINDPEWYSQDPSLLDNSAKLNYSDPFGQPIVLDVVNQDIWPAGADNRRTNFNVAFKAKAAQGVCSLVMKHSIGNSVNRNDPANVAASAFYSFVRYVNSGRKNYDPADLMIYALMVGDLYAFVQYLKRLYGYAFLYSQTNQYIGKALLEENGVNPDDIIANLANFRYFVNAFINKISSFVLPSNIPYFSRRRFMYDGLYIENAFGNLKDQLYQFVPEGFYKFAKDGKGAGCLIWTPLTMISGYWRDGTSSRPRLTLTDLTTYANSLLDNILGDEDFGLMSGDILKAYGTNIMSLESLPEDYYVLPHYDMTVLSQFKNATIAGWASRTDFYAKTYTSPNDPTTTQYSYGNIYQDTTGNILCKEGVSQGENGNDAIAAMYTVHAHKVLSVELPNPSPADNIEATRLTIAGDRIRSTFNNDILDFNCGVDYPVYMLCRSNENYRDGASSPVVLRSVHSNFRYNGIESTNVNLNMLLCLSQFKYAPTMYLMLVNNDTKALDEAYVLSNLDNYTVVTRDVLNKMHTCALLSLFYVPGVAKLINVM